MIIAENEAQQAQLLRPTDRGGCGLDGLYNDDFHHSARVALTGLREAYYSDYRGTSQELLSAAKRGFLFQGQQFSWQKKRRGTPALDRPAYQFVHFLENHDQVANSSTGRRLCELCAPGQLRALTALLLLGPATPLVFQGQETGETTRFLYFADHQGELGESVRKGRQQFLSQFTATGRRRQGNAADRSNRARDVRAVQAPARIDRAGSAVRPAAQRPASAAPRRFHHRPPGGRRTRRRDAWRTGDGRSLLWSCRRRPIAGHQSRQRSRPGRLERAAGCSANERVLEDIVVERRSILWRERYAAVAGRSLACSGPVRAAARPHV